MTIRPDTAPAAACKVSVLVPTFDRPERLRALVAGLERQTLDPEAFELIVVDDGSRVPARIEGEPRFAHRMLRQHNAGPAAARNLGLEHCRGELCLILNDDAVPAPDLLEVHLAQHARARAAHGRPLAVLGTFRFSATSKRSPFVDLLDRSDLLFDFSPLRDGELYDWCFFWTCNISLPTAALRAVGGFDAHNFPDIVEDCELGYRLEQQGYRVQYCAAAQCEHEHALTASSFFARTRRLGQSLARMFEKHGDARALRQPVGTRLEDALLRQMQATYETFHPQLARAQSALAAIEEKYAGQGLPAELLPKLSELVARVNAVPLYRGMLEHFRGADPERVMSAGAAAGALTSVIVLSHDDLQATKRCLDALRRQRESAHPIEIVFVDNGSQDGSREYLAQQADVRTIFNERNLGAPRARNQALCVATGEWIVFLDNDAIVTPHWLSRLRWQAEIDPGSACVGPLSDRSAHGQQIPVPALADCDALDAFASKLGAAQARTFRFATLLSSFCLLVRRSLIDAIGGFDERFSPWGFEDDDFTLRAALCSGHNRIALDVFVKHEAYGGPKLAQHSALLARNWRRFAAKWALAPDAAHGDYRGLEPLLARPPELASLCIPLRGQSDEQLFEHLSPLSELSGTISCATH